MRQKNYDENYFEIIDTPQKAYFLGLMYADGYVSHSKRLLGNNKIYICYKMSISLQEQDKSILELFKRELKRPNELIKIINKDISINRAIQYCFTVSGQKIHDDLVKHGCVENKSLILQFPKTVPEKLMSHFIRGYFDGDGCI